MARRTERTTESQTYKVDKNGENSTFYRIFVDGAYHQQRGKSTED